jgi:isoleucyl-tRNA synthetase
VIWKITETLVRLVAPMLTFTAEEVWGYLPHVEGREASVHLALFPQLDEIAVKDEVLLKDWEDLLLIRAEAMVALEVQRKAGKIGKGLEANVLIEEEPASGAWKLLSKYENSLKELLNVSKVEIKAKDLTDNTSSSATYSLINGDLLHFLVLPAEGTKCDRCWNYYADDGPQHVRQFGPWPNVCGRCAVQLRQMPEFARWENMSSGEDVA